MKKTLLILLSLFIVQHGLSQKIFFSDTSNVWIVDYQIFDPGIDKKYDVHYRFVDTIQVVGTQYLILEGLPSLFPPTTAYIREDTSEKKIYARINPSVDTSEHMLYDYTLVVGDTFFTYHPTDTYRHIVTAVDTLLINSIAHRRWYFTHLDPISLDYEVVEGVGCMRDPLTPYFPVSPFGVGWYLKCFRNAHTGLSSNNPSWYTANCTLGIDDPGSSSDKISIYPNPARHEVNLALPSALATSVTVYDITGRTVVRVIPQPGQQKLTVNTSAWTNGIYLVRVSSHDGSSSTAKLVVEN